MSLQWLFVPYQNDTLLWYNLFTVGYCEVRISNFYVFLWFSNTRFNFACAVVVHVDFLTDGLLFRSFITVIVGVTDVIFVMLFCTNNFQRFSVRIFHLFWRVRLAAIARSSVFTGYVPRRLDKSCLQLFYGNLYRSIFFFTGISFTHNSIRLLPLWLVKGRNESVYNCFKITICNNDASTRTHTTLIPISHSFAHIFIKFYRSTLMVVNERCRVLTDDVRALSRKIHSSR